MPFADGNDVDLSANASSTTSSPSDKNNVNSTASSVAETFSSSGPIVLTFSVTQSSLSIPTLSPYKTSSTPEILTSSGLASAYVLSTGPPVNEYTTVTVDTYTTFCPTATEITQGTETYTATAVSGSFWSLVLHVTYSMTVSNHYRYKLPVYTCHSCQDNSILCPDCTLKQR